MSSRPQQKQQGATLIVSLVMLLVITMVGLSGLYNITLQNKQVRAIEEHRLFYSESNNQFEQTLAELNTDPESEKSFATSLSGTAAAMSYRDMDTCWGLGNDLTQPFQCKSVQVTVGFPSTSDADVPDMSGPNRSYTLNYQYRDFGSTL